LPKIEGKIIEMKEAMLNNDFSLAEKIIEK
jgi:hypothetical protein